jgi:pimeloyl-ACP methyl ester carboxylesterase
MEQFRRGELIFGVRDEGPADGPVVVLLHGFPQRNDSWSAVVDKLTAQGIRCLADMLADLLLEWFSAHPTRSQP